MTPTLATPTYTKGPHCAECPLAHAPLVRGRGELDAAGHADTVIVGEGPGRVEAAWGSAFVGPSGELLERVLREADAPLGRVWLTNTHLCFTDDEKVKREAAKHCHDRLLAELTELAPRLVITLGNIAAQALLGPGPGITKRRGAPTRIPLGERRVPVLPTVHPAYVLRSPGAYPDLLADFRKAVELYRGVSAGQEAAPREVPYTLTEDYRAVLDEAARHPYAVLDLETSGLDYTRDRILCAVVAAGSRIWVIPGPVLYTGGFRRALRACPARWSAHNAKFDRNFLLAHLGVALEVRFDTMLASYLLDERSGRHGVKEIAARRYGAPDWEAPVREHLRARRTHDYGTLPSTLLYRYAALDGYYQHRLTGDLARELAREPGLTRVFKRLLLPAAEALSNAEVRGVLIDRAQLGRLDPQYAARCEALERDLCQLAGHTLNPRSAQQVAQVIFDELGIPEHHRFGRSTNWDQVLVHHRQVPFVRVLGEYREQHKVLSTYVRGIAKRLGADGRVHTNFNLHTTVTGRLSSTDPNLQNQPRDDPEYKKIFRASPGNLITYCDLSQVELRMIAWFSQDPWLLECYRAGRDLHGEMAAAVIDPHYTSEQRTFAKRLNFGLAYGLSVLSLAEDSMYDLGPTPQARLAEAARIEREYYARIHRVLEWKEEVYAQVLSRGYLETPLGRRRRFPYVPEQGAARRALFREAVNFLPQSAASDATLLAFVRCERAGLQPIITVHDSILCDVPAVDARDALATQHRIMVETAEELYGDLLPFAADGGLGPSWGDIAA